MNQAPTKLAVTKKQALAELQTDWDKQCVIAQLAVDNEDQTMFNEAMDKIHEIEDIQRWIEKQP